VILLLHSATTVVGKIERRATKKKQSGRQGYVVFMA